MISTSLEYLVVNAYTNFELLINNGTMKEQVNEFKYLGDLINQTGIQEREIKHRTQKNDLMSEFFIVQQIKAKTN